MNVPIIVNYMEYIHPNFNEGGKVHNWKNYVLDAWKENWNEFSNREKKIIFIMAKIQADNEDWD